MEAVAVTAVILALFNLGGGEIILILSLILLLVGAKNLPDLSRGLGRGLLEFRDAIKRAINAIDGEANEAGRSVGGIYGRPAAQALTPDNHVAELYDPAVFQVETRLRKCFKWVTSILVTLGRLLRRVVRTILDLGYPK